MNAQPQSRAILAPDGMPARLKAIQNNWYEASRWSPNRSWIWYPLQHADRDLDRYTRYELSKHARYLYKNSPLIRGVIERIVNIVVGSGYFPVFKGSNKKWVARTKAWWAKRSRNVHLGAKCSAMNYQRCSFRAKALDGEGFTIKTFDEDVTMKDCIQGIESDRCTGAGEKDLSRDNMNDGLLLSKQGVVLAYLFRGVKEPYPAETIIHHFSPNRLGQHRGETVLASAINTARDIDDILALEKQAVKHASSIKDVIKTPSGELDPEAQRTAKWDNSNPTPFHLPDDNKTKTDYYRNKLGSESLVLQVGDEYDLACSERPGSAWQGFMDFLSNTICLSSGFPASVILPIGLGGTDIRRDLDIAQRVAEPYQLDNVAEFDEWLRYLMEGEIADGELKGAPDDWSISYQMPPKINVDRGQAQQDRMDVQAGLMSREEYHGRYGSNYDEYDSQVIAEAKARKKAIADAGFASVQEFAQVLSLDSKLFVNAGAQQPGNQPQDTQ